MSSKVAYAAQSNAAYWRPVVVWGMLAMMVGQIERLPHGQPMMYVMDIGQGDATLIKTPNGRTILIDSGPDGKVIEELNSLMSFFERTIDLVILTHPDKDHYGGLPSVLHFYKALYVLMPHNKTPSEEMTTIQTLLHEKGVQLLPEETPYNIDIDNNVTLSILWPPKNGVYDDNNSSTIVRLVTKETTVLLTGDIEKIGEWELLKTGTTLSSSILKIAHHGSRTSTSEEFLNAIQPHMAIISAGKNNRYKHPHNEVVERLEKHRIKTRTTIEEGRIAIPLSF